jgi:site-specific recombinase XerD
VPLTASALAALRAHRARQDALRESLEGAYGERGLVFAASTGAPLSARNTLRAFKAAAARAGLPATLTPHDLRRMTASLLVAGGVDVATAAAILGHKNVSVLLDVYAQALRGPKAAAARTLEGALYGTAAGATG